MMSIFDKGESGEPYAPSFGDLGRGLGTEINSQWVKLIIGG